MKRFEIVKTIMTIKIAYPNALENMKDEEIESLVDLYESHFKDYDYETVLKALHNIISTDNYCPSIARIKKEIAKILNSDMPKAEDEWLKVIDSVHKHGLYGMNKAMQEMNEFTRYVVKIIGFSNICMSTDNTWNKKEFIAEYNSLKERKEELMQIGEKATLTNKIEYDKI